MKLKPVIYSTSYYRKGANNTAQQIFLLKALKVTSDPNKLRQMIGVKSVAEVYRTLDKLAMRKEYHEALARSGVSFDFIVGGLKGIADNGEKDGDRVKAYQILLKSLGLDKYDVQDGGTGGSWEEALLKGAEASQQLAAPIDAAYEVRQPVMPEAVKKAEEEETKILKSIYE